MSNQYNLYSFKQWCLDTNNQFLLDLWNYKLNVKNPENVGFKSNIGFWFNCPRGLHEEYQLKPSIIVRSFENNVKAHLLCKKCNSFGQHVIDEYGKEYLDNIWSIKNNISPFDISFCSTKTIWMKCINNDQHPDYDLKPNTFWISHGCPYCSGDRVCNDNSLGFLYPQSIEYWSEKNEKTPFDFTAGSKKTVWFKCPIGIHDDYKRQIVDQIKLDYRCPKCSFETLARGKNHYRWKGGVSKENEIIRHSIEYNEWRNKVYKKDYYTCQCCLRSDNRLEAHHLKDFASNVELRFDVNNGITLCKDCHNARIKGSFHNSYGTFGKTEKELEEYINNKRKELGINIPFSINDYFNGNILKSGDIPNVSLGVWIFNLYSPSELKHSNIKRIIYKQINDDIA